MVASRELEGENESLKKLLNGKKANEPEVQRLKVAFAEGYIAGHSYKPTGRTFKIMKVLQHIMMAVSVFIFFIAIIGVYKS